MHNTIMIRLCRTAGKSDSLITYEWGKETSDQLLHALSQASYTTSLLLQFKGYEGVDHEISNVQVRLP